MCRLMTDNDRQTLLLYVCSTLTLLTINTISTEDYNVTRKLTFDLLDIECHLLNPMSHVCEILSQ